MSKLDQLAVVAVTGCCAFLAFAVPAPFFLATLAGSGVLAWRAYRTGRRELAICAVVMPLFVLLRPLLLAGVTVLTPHTVDASLARLGFGLEPKLYNWLLLHVMIRNVLRFSYYSLLPFWMAVVMAWESDARQ